MALLPQLRTLDVETWEVVVDPSLSCATQLSHLRLRSEERLLPLPPGCLPLSLRSLDVSGFSPSAADALSFGVLPRLERLGLHCFAPLDQVQSGWGKPQVFVWHASLLTAQPCSLLSHRARRSRLPLLHARWYMT